MPKSKRNRVVPLSKVTKKGPGEKKERQVKNIHKYLKQYKYCYAFTYKNMTNIAMNSLKEYLKDSVFMIGKNHVMQVGLGKTEEEESKQGSSNLNKYLKGNCGLFFTDKDPDDIISYFKEYSSPYFGNVGSVSNQTLILKRGFDEHLADFPSSMESQFRQLGMNIKIDDGKFCLLDDYIVCQKGKELTPDQSKMCKHLNIYLDEFKIFIKAYLGNNGLYKEVEVEDN